jgi:hypothetical protein
VERKAGQIPHASLYVYVCVGYGGSRACINFFSALGGMCSGVGGDCWIGVMVVSLSVLAY